MKKHGCGNILGINVFLFWVLIFFYGFNWRWRRFDWGWAVPAEGVGLKKKQLEGGWGGGRSPQMHSQNMLGDLPPVRRIFWPCHNLSSVHRKHLVPLDSFFFVSCVHKRFWALRFISILGP